MPAWHGRYAIGTRVAKAALAPVVADYRNGTTGSEVAAACRQLRVAVDGVLDRRELLSAPDRRVALALRNAFGELRQLAAACEAGRHLGDGGYGAASPEALEHPDFPGLRVELGAIWR